MRQPNPLYINDTRTNKSKNVILFGLTIDKQLTSKLDIVNLCCTTSNKHYVLESSINRTWTRNLDLRKVGPIKKIEPQGLETLSFISCHMKQQ